MTESHVRYIGTLIINVRRLYYKQIANLHYISTNLLLRGLIELVSINKCKYIYFPLNVKENRHGCKEV